MRPSLALFGFAALFVGSACGLTLDVADESQDGGSVTVADGNVPLCEPDACASMTLTHTIGRAASRDFATIGSWERARRGDLTARHVLAVRGESGTFQPREPVVGEGGCMGVYVPGDDKGSNGPTMSLDEYAGRCARGDVLRGQRSGARASYRGHLAVGTVERGEAYADAVFDENVVLQGSTTDPDHYRWLTVAPGHRHHGHPGAGVVLRPRTPGHGIQIAEEHALVEWVEVTEWSRDHAGSFDGINIVGDEATVQYVLVHDDGNGGASNPDANGITLEETGLRASVRNSIVYGVARSGISIHNVTDAELSIVNTTVHRCTENDNIPRSYGCIALFGAARSIIHAINSMATGAQNGGNDFSLHRGMWGTMEANLSSDDSAPGIDAITSAPADEQYVSTERGAEDLHLRAGSVAIGAGSNLSDEALDIDGEPRPAPPAPWDIGADQHAL